MNVRSTMVVPIIDLSGKILDEISLSESIMPIPNKRGGFSSNGTYYKGAGIVYRNHLGCSYKFNEEYGNTVRPQILGKTELVYENLILCYPELVGKFGIFCFQHQPVFSDYEGACGVKESKLIQNQKEFELSAIDEIVNIIPTGIPDTSIYAYRLKAISGNIHDTVRLIRYVLENNWNTAWDKNLWDDIECFGYVRDVADWFRSERFNHKLGTVFALLNSLYRRDRTLYARLLLEIFGTYSFDKKSILLMSAAIVNKYCRQFSGTEYDCTTDNEECFEMLYKQLVTGKACCHLEKDSEWEWVRNYYLKNRERRMKQ